MHISAKVTLMSRHPSNTRILSSALISLLTIVATQLPVFAYGKTKDVTPPKAILMPIVMVDGVPVLPAVGTGKAFSLTYYAQDDSKSAKVTFSLYSNGSLIRTDSSSGFISAMGMPAIWKMKPAPVPKQGPDGVGPYYVCIGAQDGSGNRSLNFPRTQCIWVAIEVPIELVSNGCGGTQWGKLFANVQSWFLDERTYGGVLVKFKRACDIHDAGYSGVAVMDPVLKRIVDYRPWSRLSIDKEFQQNLEHLCTLYFGKAKSTEPTYKLCDPGVTLAKYAAHLLIDHKEPIPISNPGAQTYFDAVRKFAKGAYDTDPTKPKTQTDNMPSTFPVGGGRNNS
jgi:hypothetical protein